MRSKIKPSYKSLPILIPLSIERTIIAILWRPVFFRIILPMSRATTISTTISFISVEISIGSIVISHTFNFESNRKLFILQGKRDKFTEILWHFYGNIGNINKPALGCHINIGLWLLGPNCCILPPRIIFIGGPLTGGPKRF